MFKAYDYNDYNAHIFHVSYVDDSYKCHVTIEIDINECDCDELPILTLIIDSKQVYCDEIDGPTVDEIIQSASETITDTGAMLNPYPLRVALNIMRALFD